MPITEVTITVWICNLCGKSASSKGPALLAAQEFIDVLRWLQLDDTTVVCDRCRKTPEVAHGRLVHERAALI